MVCMCSLALPFCLAAAALQSDPDATVTYTQVWQLC